jgi:hypothetical protein
MENSNPEIRGSTGHSTELGRSQLAEVNPKSAIRNPPKDIDVIPVLAPLLSPRDYSISLSINPLIDEGAPKDPVRYTVSCHSNKRPEPVVFHVEKATAQGAHLFDLSAELRRRAPEEDFEKGYFVIHRHLNQPDGGRFIYKPPVWVGYTTPKSYLIIPAGLVYASARMINAPEKLSCIVEYFGHAAVTERMTTVIAASNPYPGDIETRFELFASDQRRAVGSGKFTIRTHTSEYIDVAALIPADFRHTPLALKATSNYRLIYFAMYYDKQDRIFYAGDHFLAWQVLF